MRAPARAAAHRRWVDGAAASGLLIVTVVGTLAAATVQQSPRPVDRWAVLLLAAAAAGWWWRLRSPLGGLGIAAAVTAGYVAVGYPFGPVQVVVALAALTLGRRRSGRSTAVGAAVAAGLLAAGLWARQQSAGSHVDLPLALATTWASVFVVIPALVGALARLRAAAVERTREELLTAGVHRERLRMAQEVHDVAGHGFALVAMQAGVALTVLDEQPAQARASLEAIRTTSTRALHELRAALDAFPDRSPLPDPDPDRAVPVPGLDELIDRVRAGGLEVDVEQATTAQDPDGLLPVEVVETVYRVAQEALTNVMRHADTDQARLRLVRHDGEVVVEVTDHGAGPRARPTGGRGLDGLRDRVEGLGGRFRAGTAAGGGFEVSARLPSGRR